MTESATASGARKGSAALVFVVVVGQGLGALTPTAMIPSLPAMAAHFGAENGEMFAKTVTTVPALMIVLGAPLVGLAAERFGERLCLLASFLLFAVAGAAGLLISDFGALIASRALVGLATAGMMTICSAMIEEHFDGETRKRLFGFAPAMGGLVTLLGLIFGGLLVDRAGWRAPFSFFLFGLVLVPATAWAMAPGFQRNSAIKTPRGKDQGSAASLLDLTPLYLALLILSVGIFAPLIQSPFLLASNGMTSATLRSEVIGVSVVAGTMTGFLFGFVSRFLGDRLVMTVTALLLAAGNIGIAAFHDLAWLMGAFFVVGMGSGMVVPSFSAMILARAPESARGRAAGLIYSALFFGQLVTPFAATALQGAFGLDGTFVALGVLLVLLVGLVNLPGILTKPPVSHAEPGPASI